MKPRLLEWKPVHAKPQQGLYCCFGGWPPEVHNCEIAGLRGQFERFIVRAPICHILNLCKLYLLTVRDPTPLETT